MANRNQLPENRRRPVALILAAFWACLLLAAPGFATPKSMSIGLAGVVDWSVQQPFLDVMKTARPWIGHRPGQWGGMDSDALEQTDVFDKHGWPRRIPDGLRGVGTVVLTDMPPQARSLAGRYRLRFEGDGIVEVGGRASNVRYGEGEVLFTFEPGPGPVVVTINKTDRAGTGDYVRNISIVHERHAAALDSGAIFNPDWTRHIGHFGTLRFMDWMDTNDSRQSEWQDRPKPGDYTYARHGVPVEVMVRLANQMGANPWFNMPHLATDEYIRRFALYVRDTLDPSLRTYAEFSNEVWNWQFQQAVWAEDEAKIRWGVEHGWMQFYGLATAEMAAIWKDAYGAEAAQRLVTVISTQTGWIGLERDTLTAPLWVAENPDVHSAPADMVEAYAISGYFGHVLGTTDRADLLRDMLTKGQDQAVELAAQELRNGAHSGEARDTLDDLVNSTFPYHARVAREFGLDLIMYEGGSHVTGIHEMIDDQQISDFFVTLNYTPQMGALYRDLLQGWADAGGSLFNVYADVVAPGKWGSWGALRHLDDQNPRWDAILSAGQM